MTTTTIALVVAFVLLPILFILWLTESRSTRINRMRSNGWTVTAIAKKYGVSRSTIRRWSVA